MKRMLPLLAALVLAASATSALAQGRGGGSSGLRHVTVYGQVSGLLSGTGTTPTTFTLTTDDGVGIPVTLSSSATVTLRSSGATATLANGQFVYVRGTYDLTTKAITATSVVVDDVVRNVNVYGFVSGYTTGGTSFTLQHESQTLTVNLTSSTTITNLVGGATTTLANGVPVFVRGSYNPLTNTITATSIKVDNRTFRVRLVGGVTNLASDGSSFTLQLANGQTIPVTVGSTTTIRNLTNGSTATLANGQKVTVTGMFSMLTQTLTATSIVVDNRTPTATGRVSNIDATAGTFTLTVYDATFFPTGTTITVATDASTTYRTRRGTGTFASLQSGQFVTVTGAFDAGTQTLTAANVRIGW